MTSPGLMLTFASAKTALAEGLRAIGTGQNEFDLANLTSIDSSGIAVLLAWQRAAQARGSRIQLRNPPDSLLSLAALYGVSELLALEKIA